MNTPEIIPRPPSHASTVPRFAWAGARLLALSLVLLIAVAYWWFESTGRLEYRPVNRGYYSMMADGFSNYRLSLLEEPAPVLLEQPDPYDPAQNFGKKIHDASLYKDSTGTWRYAFYWGPAPAALIMIQRHLPTWMQLNESDPALVFYFAITVLVAGALLLIWVRETFYPMLSWTAVAWAVPVVGLISPIPYFLARPAIYEASIVGGQAFLIVGIVFATWALHALGRDERAVAVTVDDSIVHDPIAGDAPVPIAAGDDAPESPDAVVPVQSPGARRWTGPIWLVLAGMSWASAVGTRQSLAVAVIGLSGLVFVFLTARFIRERRALPTSPKVALRRALLPLACLVTPLVMAAVVLCVMNYKRFGNPLEFGVKYQLAGLYPRKLMEAGVYSSSQYVWPNLSRYLLDKPNVVDTFPFVTAILPDESFFKQHPVLPPGYGGEPVAGVLWSSPVLVFGLIPPLAALALSLRGRRLSTESWLALMLATGGCLALLVALFPMGSTMRYLIDFVPCTALLAVMGLWQRARWYAARGRPAYPLVAIASVLVTYSLVVSLLLGMTGYSSNLERLNPQTFDLLRQLFS